MSPSINRAVDYFVPQKQVANTAEPHRYQLFVVISFVLASVIAGAQAYGFFISDLPWNDMLWTLGFTLPIQFTLVSALFYLKHTGDFSRAVFMTLAIMFVVLVVVVFFLGGPLRGASAMMLFVPPLFAFLLLGLKAGILWAASTYAVMLAGSMAEIFGFVYPYIDNTPHASVGKLIHLSVSFFSIFFMMVFYEHSSQRYREQLEQLARQDDLTRLPNRSAFYRAIESAIAEYQQSRQPFTLIYIDLDNFKPINDEYGHGVGDEVLKAFARRLRAAVREQDFVCRLGGDEFAVLMHGTMDERIAGFVLGRLDKKMASPINLRNGVSVAVRASTGFAFYPHDAASLEAILHAADERMYGNKRESKLNNQPEQKGPQLQQPLSA